MSDYDIDVRKKMGLLPGRYQVRKADGRAPSPEAKYFVLRYDKDDEWGRACRGALRDLCNRIRDSYPLLSDELLAEVRRHEAGSP